MRPKVRLRDRWMWDWVLLRLWVITPIVLALVLAVALYPALGMPSLYSLLLALVGLPIGAAYGIVGGKVRSLKRSLSAEGGETVESLIVIDRLQSPGVAVLRETELVLVPIAGTRRAVAFGDIRSVRSVRVFNGKTLVGKRWLVLSTSPRLGFALPEQLAMLWFGRLSSAAEQR